VSFLSCSRNLPRFTEPEVSLPHWQQPPSCPNPVRTLPYYFCTVRLHIIVQSTPNSSVCSQNSCGLLISFVLYSYRIWKSKMNQYARWTADVMLNIYRLANDTVHRKHNWCERTLWADGRTDGRSTVTCCSRICQMGGRQLLKTEEFCSWILLLHGDCLACEKWRHCSVQYRPLIAMKEPYFSPHSPSALMHLSPVLARVSDSLSTQIGLWRRSVTCRYSDRAGWNVGGGGGVMPQ